MKKTSKTGKKSHVTKQINKSFRKIKVSSLLSYIIYILILIKYFLHTYVKVTTNFVFKGKKSLTMGFIL